MTHYTSALANHDSMGIVTIMQEFGQQPEAERHPFNSMVEVWL